MTTKNLFAENKRMIRFMMEKGVILPGSICEEQFWLLIEISSVHSKKVINAMRDHLVSGISRKEVCERYNVNNGYLSISIGRLNHTHNIVRNLMMYYNDD